MHLNETNNEPHITHMDDEYHYNRYMENKNYYPFDEGDTYYTIEYGEIIESTWDFVSEEMYDENPKQEYFISYKSAYEWLNNKQYENTSKQKSTED